MRARNGFIVLLLLARCPARPRSRRRDYALTPRRPPRNSCAPRSSSSAAAPRRTCKAASIRPTSANLKAALDGNPAAQQGAVCGRPHFRRIRRVHGCGDGRNDGRPNGDGRRARHAAARHHDSAVAIEHRLHEEQRRSVPALDAARCSATANAGAAATASARRTSDEALPMPANAGAVLPSSILARLPRLDTIKRGTDCTLGGLQATVEKETAQAVALQDAYYGNPGDSGLEAHTPPKARSSIGSTTRELESCGIELNMGTAFSPEYTAADAAWNEASSRITQEQEAAWAACPGIPGGKEPAASARSTPTRHARSTPRSGNSSLWSRNRSRRASRRCAPAP